MRNQSMTKSQDLAACFFDLAVSAPDFEQQKMSCQELDSSAVVTFSFCYLPPSNVQLCSCRIVLQLWTFPPGADLSLHSLTFN
jgi:hypothetical protein